MNPSPPNPPARPHGPGWTFGLASLLLLTVAIGAEIVVLKNADGWGRPPWNAAPAPAICVLTGAAIGMIELRSARGFGALRGRLFQGALGGMLGGGVFAILNIAIKWYARSALGEEQPPWTDGALSLGTWLLWGGLAGGVLGAVVDVCLAPRRRPTAPRGDQRAAEFLAALPEKADKPEGPP